MDLTVIKILNKDEYFPIDLYLSQSLQTEHIICNFIITEFGLAHKIIRGK